MNSNSEKTIGSNSSLKPNSQSFNFENIISKQNKPKNKNKKGIHTNNRIYEYQRKKGDFKYLEKYIYKHFISLYKNSKNDYNSRMIEDILNNENTHLVAEFKDYLIMGDITEFLQKSYNIKECKKYLPKIYEYYNSCSVIFPNYVNLHESKYIYKNIRKKQKVIDNQQEQEEKQEKIKKGNIKLENNEDFFTTKIFNSILDQTNTSNVKLLFGLNDKIDANETPNNIMVKLENAEKEVMRRKITLIKNNKNSRKINELMGNNNTINNININDKNIFNNNSKVYNKNKSLKEKNKNSNCHINLTGSKKKSNSKINHKYTTTDVNSNANSNININYEKENRVRINNYFSKNQNQNSINSKPNTNTNSNTQKENTIKNNYSSFHSNSISNTKKQEIKKFLIDNNSRNRAHQIYFKNINRSNKNIKRQLINSLFHSKPIFNKIFNNYDNNSNSVLKHNSFNLMNQKSIGKLNSETNQILNSPGFYISPSSITIQTNPFKNKNNYNININIKESNSTRNIINNKLNYNKSKEKLNLKNGQDKLKRNKNNSHNIIDYNSKTISTSSTYKTTTNKENIKYIHKNKNFVYNKAQTNNNYSNLNYNVYSNFKTIGNNRNIDSQNGNNNSGNYMIKNLNIHKINSTSNIQKPMNMNMNININMNNTNKNKIYIHDGLCTNIIQNKIYTKSPKNVEFETIKVSQKKRTLYPRGKLYTDIPNNNNAESYKPNIYSNFNNNIIDNTNNILNDKNYYIDSLNHTSLNSNNLNEDIINSGINQNYNNKYISNAKKTFFLDELYRKKNIILPFNKEINSINININGYNPKGGSLTSRTSNNPSKKKFKRNPAMQEKSLYNSENTRNKINIKNNSNLISRNEGNPVKIKKISDSNKKNEVRNGGFLSAKKK